MKRVTITITLIFLFSLCVNAQNNASPQKMYEQTPNRIEMLYNVNSFDLFLSGKYKALIKQMQRKDSSSEYYKELYTLYTIAACYDKLKKHDSTICYLTKFMDKARDDRYILIGNDFNNLKNNSLKWKLIVNRIEQSYLQLLGDNMDKELALKIFYLCIGRLRLMEDGAFNPSEDLKIIEEMEKIVDKQGMPTYSNVGNYASCNAAHTLWYSEKLPQYYPLIQAAFLRGK